MITQSPAMTNPYVGPRTFTYAQRHLFFGREREARDLLARMLSERLLLFYAQSGAGKSSLLHTRLIPQLQEEKGFVVLPVARVSGELLAGLEQVDNIYTFNLMLSIDEGDDPARLAQVTLTDFFARLTQRTLVDQSGAAHRGWIYDATQLPAPATASPSTRRYALIVDQFEEIITAFPERWRERAAFFRQIDQAMRSDPNLWVVFTLREDYVASLDPYAPLLADRLRARFYMERMGVEAALAAIKQPALLAGHPFAEGVAPALVDNLRRIKVIGQTEEQLGQYVEPVQLQVVCYQLWEKVTAAESTFSTEITMADLENSGDVDTALADFYEQAIAAALATPGAMISERQLRTWFDDQLITGAGTRGTVYRAPADTAGLSNQIVDALQARFLLRSELRAGGIWVELVHDRLVEPILASNRRWLFNQNNPVTSAARLWDENGQQEQFLLRGELLNQAQHFAISNPQILGDLERNYLEACEQQRTLERARRNQYLAITMTIATFIALMGIIYAFRQRTIANAALVANYSILQADKEVDTALLLAVEGIKIYDSPETRSQLHYATARSYEPQQALLTAHEDEVWGTAYSPDGQFIATASQDGSILFWDAKTYQVLRRLQVPKINLSYYRIAFSPDGRLLAAGGFGGYLVIWDVKNGKADQILKKHVDSIFNLAFSPDGAQLVTVGADRQVILWDVATWQSRVIGEHEKGIWGIWDVAFSPDGMILATAGRDKTVRLWDLTKPASISHTLILTNHEAIVTSVAFHPSLTTTLLVSGDVNGEMILWNLDPWRKAQQRPLHSKRLEKQVGYFWSLAFSPNGSILASTSSRFTLHYWQFDLTQAVTHMDPKPLSLFLRGHTDDLVDGAFSPDGQKVVVASIDGTASVWAVNHGNLLSAEAGLVKSMALIDKEKTLLTANPTGLLRAWDTTAYQSLLWEWSLGTSALVSLTLLSADGTRLLSASADRTIQLWDVVSKTALLQVQPISMSPVVALALSQDATQIAAGQQDGRISLWQINRSMQIAGGALGQQGRVDALAFSRDNRWLATGGCNLDNVKVIAAIGCPGEILVWDTTTRLQKGAPLIKTGNNNAVGYAQLGHISALAFSHDHQKLASGSSRGLVTVWDLAAHKVLDENKEHKQASIRSLIFSPDDSLLISAGPWGTLDDDTGSIILWDVERGVRFGRSLNEHDDRVNALLLNKDGLALYSAGDDGYIVVNNLDVNYWFRRACQIANRNLTLREWERYLGGRAYRKTCPAIQK